MTISSGSGEREGAADEPSRASVSENLQAPDTAPRQFVEDPPRVVLPKADQALADSIEHEQQREQRKDRARPWLLITLALAYFVLVIVGIVSAFNNSAGFDKLLRLYSVAMPVLTAAIGGAVAYYFTSGGPKSG